MKVPSQSRAPEGMENHMAAAKLAMEGRAYRDAARKFAKALQYCTCVRRPSENQGPAGSQGLHTWGTTCLFEGILEAATSEDMGGIYNVAKDPCRCGRRKPSCRQELHVEALDKMAACQAAEGLFRGAAECSAAIIHMAPDSPVGYCRLSKVMRSQLAHKGQDPWWRTTEPNVVASIMKQGMYNVKTHGDKNHPLLKIMQVIRSTASRRDPFQKFTNEIKVMIFSHLNLSDLCACMRVSKAWRSAIQGDPYLWRDLHLGKVKSPPTTKQLTQLLKRAVRARSFVAEDTHRLGLTSDRLALIFTALPDLCHLHLTGPPNHSLHLGHRLSARYPTKLVSLSMLGLAAVNQELVYALAHGSSGTLESLQLAGFTGSIKSLFSLPFDKLRILKLHASTAPSPVVVLEHMDVLAGATPNLEQLYVDAYVRLPSAAPGAPEQRPDLSFAWRKLRVLVLGQEARFLSGSPVAATSCWPPIPSEIRVIEILGEDSNVPSSVSSSRDLAVSDVASTLLFSQNRTARGQWSELHTFRCRLPLNDSELKQVIGPSIEQGSLRVLDIAMPEFMGFQRPVAMAPTAPAPAEFLFQSERVHTFGLSRFVFAQDDGYDSMFTAKPVLDLLSRFPNVHTVAAYPGAYAKRADIIKALLFHKGIKRIFQDCLAGVELDEALAIARQKGIQVVRRKKLMPVAFPRELHEDDWDG